MPFSLSSGLSTLGTISSAANKVGALAGALSNLSNPAALVSSIRSLSLPTGGMPTSIQSAGAVFNAADADNDWRVRLSIPTTPTFLSSPVLQPLVAAGGMVFPYTPSMSISSSANYDDQALTHQNQQFISYQNSRIDTISIDAPFAVEDATQAQYWLAVVHYFRSVTKMFTGDMGIESGNPPPIVYLNAYGDYVFKNVPVVVKSFSMTLPPDVNYIATTVGASAGSTTDFAGVTGNIGSGGIASMLGAGSAIRSVSESISNIMSGDMGGTAGGGMSHVPVKSQLSVTLQPIYSRQTVRQFNLGDFVNGNYVNNLPGHI